MASGAVSKTGQDLTSRSIKRTFSISDLMRFDGQNMNNRLLSRQEVFESIMRGTRLDPRLVWRKQAVVYQTDGSRKVVPATDSFMQRLERDQKKAREEALRLKMNMPIEFPQPNFPKQTLFTPPKKKRRVYSISIAALSTNVTSRNKPSIGPTHGTSISPVLTT